MDYSIRTAGMWILAISAMITIIFIIITLMRLHALLVTVAATNRTATALEANRNTLHEKNMAFQDAVKKPIRKAATIFKTVSIAMAIRTAIHMMQHIAEKTFTKHHE